MLKEQGITPACAGSTLFWWFCIQHAKDHPACAGSTCVLDQYTLNLQDHPRLRGEYINSEILLSSCPGSPPLARGVQKGKKYLTKAERITSACAGNTRPKRKSGRPSEDHPRLRGEYPPSAYITFAILGSPPLARGVQGCLIMGLHFPRITPACAGSTDRGGGRCGVLKDHPRLRGEYHGRDHKIHSHRRSPPLARGVPTTKIILLAILRITPACAGSTRSR